METNEGHGEQGQKEFEYVLEDYLELRASLDNKKARFLKKFLYSQKLGQLVLLPVEGLALDRHLILFKSDNPHAYKHLVFLNPSDGCIRVRVI